MTSGITGLLIAGAAAALVLRSSDAFARPPLGRTWPPAERVSFDWIDHAPWTELLKRYADERGLVDYAAWKASASGRTALRRYLERLSRGEPGKPATRAAKLAFWINAYNAVTIEGILQEYPTESIRNHTARLVGYNIWMDLPLLVGGKRYSLHQMEHGILQRMGEPRIHFAINCASIGCPKLRREAYTAGKIEEQLAGQTREFFRQPRHFQADHEAGVIYVSPVLKWFARDFGATQAQRWGYLAPYLPAEDRPLARDPDTTVKNLEYDWSLNDQQKR